jgi:hypothetical protein
MSEIFLLRVREKEYVTFYNINDVEENYPITIRNHHPTVTGPLAVNLLVAMYPGKEILISPDPEAEEAIAVARCMKGITIIY